MYTDELSLQRIGKLHPKLREDAKLILEAANAKLTGRAKVRYAFTLRSFDEQNQLYRLGRTVRNPDGASGSKPLGNIVTNARAGASYHNYGLAIDIALLIDTDGNGTYETASWDRLGDYDGDRVADWMEVVAVFKSFGWEWGGDWHSFKDFPHFQKSFGLSITDLLKLVQNKKVDGDGYIIV